jgi:toxin ParE1/3/4
VAEYRLTPRAEKDLEEIWRYTAEQWSVDQAETYVGELFDIMSALAIDPGGGRRADNVRPGYRRRNAGSHVIFYRVARNGIEVVRVLHLRMDIESHFP